MDPFSKLLLLVVVKILCKKIHIHKAYIIGGEACFDIEPTTPISVEKIAAIADKRIIFLSEFSLSIKLNRKGWKNDINMIIKYLKKFAGTVDDE